MVKDEIPNWTGARACLSVSGRRRQESLTVGPDLVDRGALLEDVLDLLDSHVLPLAQLEDVLLAVDDAEGPIRRDLANVARVEPALRVERLLGLLLVLVVGLENGRATEADLATGGLRLGVIPHLGDRLEPAGGVGMPRSVSFSLLLPIPSENPIQLFPLLLSSP